PDQEQERDERLLHVTTSIVAMHGQCEVFRSTDCERGVAKTNRRRTLDAREHSGGSGCKTEVPIPPFRCPSCSLGSSEPDEPICAISRRECLVRATAASRHANEAPRNSEVR